MQTPIHTHRFSLHQSFTYGMFIDHLKTTVFKSLSDAKKYIITYLPQVMAIIDRGHVFYIKFMGNELFYKFNVYKVLDADEKELEKSNNPFAVVVRVVQTALKKEQLAEIQLFDLKIELVKELLKKKFTNI